ncbi:protein snakeskin [Anabrus simplex]|uniref:protein snakeskin n=1 Tax=Anabrus simplex TaxID=316456 RepID=UPI0035A3737A
MVWSNWRQCVPSTMASKIFPVKLKELKQPGFILKFLEIALLITTTLVARLGRSGHPISFHKQSVDADILGHGVCLAYLIISPVLLLGYLLGEIGNEKRKMEFLFNCLGALLLLISGAIAVDFWRSVGLVPITAEVRHWDRIRQELFSLVESEKSAGLSLGCLSLLSAFLYLIDAFFGYRMGINGS